MIKEYLKDNQEIAYKLLCNALINHKVAHAYLFCGQCNDTMVKAALFLAASIICDHDIACESCNNCQRVFNFNYGDLVYIDGTNDTIKKEQIMALQQQFSKTALEANGHKVYIINHVENATDASLNSLLKFLEEPNGDMINAILITSNIYQVLPTIVSRCEIINFKPDDKHVNYVNLVNSGIDEMDSYMLSQLHLDVKYLEEEDYQLAFVAFKYFVEKFYNGLDDFLVYYQLEMFGKDKDMDIRVADLFMDMVSVFLVDLKIKDNDYPEWYKKYIEEFDDKISVAKLLLVVLQQKDKINKTNNLRLIMDEMVYRMMEVIHE